MKEMSPSKFFTHTTKTLKCKWGILSHAVRVGCVHTLEELNVQLLSVDRDGMEPLRGWHFLLRAACHKALKKTRLARTIQTQHQHLRTSCLSLLHTNTHKSNNINNELTLYIVPTKCTGMSRPVILLLLYTKDIWIQDQKMKITQ